MNSGSKESTHLQDKAYDWAQLAQQDPVAFETMRTELLNEFIQNSPASIQKKLEGIQWKIEHVRRRANSPVEALAEITGMMWQSTQLLSKKQQDLLDVYAGKEVTASPTQESAQILHFQLRAN
ncbi:MAG: DUF3135 domain-containing protein [Thiotrichaceae bacterium]|nr:DUF3135 domain-containing protein [Thiotrichaceae bacterium]PCI11144.1 MAG: hypothetical protein COB71_11955 [Thiotrichales bacterium]PCI12881.1 MAG: hypothetical protein COB71_07750 [Thiotrichales bacterium]